MPRAILLLVATGIALAQPSSVFEVASLRRHVTPPGQPVYRRVHDGFALEIKGNRVTAQLLTLTELTADAYGVRDFQIQNAPDWAKPSPAAEYYDLQAIAGETTMPTVAQAQRMLQALLADRFQLKLRHESNELAVYNLTIAKGGNKLLDASGSEPPKLPANIPPGVTFLRGNLTLLMSLIAPRVDRPVLDKTGLSGTYVYPWSNPNPADDTSIFTLLQDELGLKLEPARARVDVLVIEHAEKPSEN